MNQDQNNINPYNFNAQGYNNIPNNQTVNNQNFNQGIEFNQQQNILPQSEQKQPKKNKLIIVLAIIGGIVVGFIILFVLIFSIISSSSEKLVCKSNEGDITIMYDENGITGYTAVGITYDLDGQKKYAEQVGVEAYINEFATWFKNNTSGTCTINNKN